MNSPSLEIAKNIREAFDSFQPEERVGAYKVFMIIGALKGLWPYDHFYLDGVRHDIPVRHITETSRT